MEIIIGLLFVGIVAYLLIQKPKPEVIDKPWPFGDKLPEGKIHVKTNDLVPGKSEADRVEAPALVSAPYKVPETADIASVPLVVEQAPAKKAPAKKPAAKKTAVKPAVPKKPAAAKRAPAKKKSV